MASITQHVDRTWTANLRTLASRWLSPAEQLLLPPQCAACHQDFDDPPDDGILLCEPCRRELVPPGCPTCRQCAATVPFPQPTNIAATCPRCAGHRWYFNSAVALGRYVGPLRQAVLRMKLLTEEPLSMGLGQLCAARFGAQLADWQPSVIAPIPMHWTRRIAHSVNSPELVAAEISRAVGVRWVGRLLKRRRRTLPHGTLSRDRRQENIRGAFGLSRLRSVRNARVLLVDDILTTGVTCNEAAKVLHAAGAAAVAVVVVARAE